MNAKMQIVQVPYICVYEILETVSLIYSERKKIFCHLVLGWEDWVYEVSQA